mmetsp:Transcript_13939/g.23712  ORF Transcript_13939/g.23712 Transcript_13939/m.23712 type:complete len:124 (+) Transcript_13939:827-1198(+)
MAMKGLLKYALNKNEDKEKADDSDSDNDQDFSKFGSKKGTKEEREKRKKELEDLKKQGKDQIDESNAIRLPNRISHGVTIDPNTGTAKQGNDRDVIMSPTSFLRGAASPRLNSFVAGNEEDTI